MGDCIRYTTQVATGGWPIRTESLRERLPLRQWGGGAGERSNVTGD